MNIENLNTSKYKSFASFTGSHRGGWISESKAVNQWSKLIGPPLETL